MDKPVSQQVEEQILQKIKAGIKARSLRPGDRLPPERGLALEFRVSRNTVREAIRTLVEKGILISRRGAGSYVTEEAEDIISGRLKKNLEKRRRHLAEVLEVRALLEPVIAARAAITVTPEDIAGLEAVLEQQRQALARGESPVAFDEAFHETLVKATGNGVLWSVYDTLRGILSESRAEDLQTKRRVLLSVEAHERILRALKKKDPGAASREMAMHMEAVEKDVNP
ncbi:FadR/GntR family transcriptional regulator [Desulfospira joergensenii]|uniref:FadR/GntR family transcriptional regulator n=1 Tax=Desulfospira joergensenii TaxID=53329 RepID=UPI0003B59046|nr:FadR/GntR family transcriptional regulator [Desulfospira joergensenii]